MNQQTITRQDLAEVIFRKTSISRKMSNEIIDGFIQEIIGSLEKGEDVKLAKFGTFFIREKKERIGRNPKTKEEFIISARKVVLFKPSSTIKKYLYE
ncbi:MAG: integration host factor subunit alpha [Proteobacteria bacterium]|nr:integration host factor subunit alpha [Pseudomonadota bacterium]